MGLLSSPSHIVREEHVIKDNGMLFPCDREYAELGSREGWLVYVHGYTDYRSVLVHTYYFIDKD